jgi:hypothetical protein
VLGNPIADSPGTFLRSIVEPTDPDRYVIRVAEHCA